MTCSVAVAAGSPVFSPSRMSLSCNCKTSSPETLTLAHHSHASDASPSSSSSFRLRFQKGPGGFRAVKTEISAPDFDYSSSSSSSATCGLEAPAAATVLKRKRPARFGLVPPIDIPPIPAGIFTEELEKVGPEEAEVESARFSVFCKRGRKKKKMEDRYRAATDVNGDSQQAFFGVFDGHGGSAAADFAANNLDKHIISEIGGRVEEDGNWIENAVKTGYLKADSEFLKKEDASGACCVTALIKDGNLIVSNAGDCRAVMSRGGAAEALTSDHRPSRDDERDRVKRNGCFVHSTSDGVLRLWGYLAVSRGIGDAGLKKWVTAEPETKILRIKPEFEFLILASDGLWDKVSNQEAVDIARPLCIDSDQQSLLPACKKLADLSIERGSPDDISVMIIPLRHFI